MLEQTHGCGLISKLVKPGHKMVVRLALQLRADVEAEDMYR
jgi:hypothetical protein